MQNKSHLRHTLLAARRALATDICTDWDSAIGKHLINWLQAHPATSLGVYWPIRNEPNLRAVYPLLAARGIQLALPAVVDKEAPLQFRIWSPADALTKDMMGVPAPAETRPAIRPGAILVPCVGFNAGLIRLGYGGGLYDRSLAQTARPVTIGIAYACAQSAFEAEVHDVALDVVITETAILSAG